MPARTCRIETPDKRASFNRPVQDLHDFLPDARNGSRSRSGRRATAVPARGLVGRGDRSSDPRGLAKSASARSKSAMIRAFILPRVAPVIFSRHMPLFGRPSEHRFGCRTHTFGYATPDRRRLRRGEMKIHDGRHFVVAVLLHETEPTRTMAKRRSTRPQRARILPRTSS